MSAALMTADNLLYYGDNLDVLRRHVKDETVDLVYLDPPFNSNATYNVPFTDQNGSRAAVKQGSEPGGRTAHTTSEGRDTR